MAYIDDLAAIAAVKHARKPVVTASTDSVDFLSPVKVGDSIQVEGFVTSAHKTSMEVFVKVVQEALMSGKKGICATASLTFVALDDDGTPTIIQQIYPDSDIEKNTLTGEALTRE